MFSNGNKYIGEFFDDTIQGSTIKVDFILCSSDIEGIMHYINGDVYSGSWDRGFYQGKGSLRYIHGESYEGA